MDRIAAALVAAGALLAASPAAPARAPTAAEQASLDSVLRRLQREREEDQKAPLVQDPADLYATGFAPLEEWKNLVEIIKDDKKRKRQERDKAASALIKRFQMEETRNVDLGKVNAQRREMLKDLVRLIVDDDMVGRECVHRIFQRPPAGIFSETPFVPWAPSDSLKRRQDAAKAILKILNQ